MPHRSGTFGFACGMNMVHGKLIVEPSHDSQATAEAAAVPPLSSEGTHAAAHAGEAEDTEAAGRKAEIADLTRRVVIGAMLSAPVALAVMAHDLFGLHELGGGRVLAAASFRPGVRGRP